MVKGSADRRTPEELHTLYQLEPGVRDVYTEGRTDVSLIRWYLRESGDPRPKVYAIDDRAEVSSDLVLSVTGAEIGPRGRILGLAKAASTWEGTAENNITCLIDCDRDCVYPTIFEAPNLLRTDFGSIDVYAFQEKPLQKFIEVVLRRTEDASEIRQDLTPILNQLFCLRVALHEIETPIINSFSACVSYNRSTMSIDLEELARRSLSHGGVSSSVAQVLDRATEIEGALPDDRFRAVRGHDIAPLLIKRLSLRNERAKVEFVESSMRATISTQDLDEHPFFKELRKRVGLV